MVPPKCQLERNINSGPGPRVYVLDSLGTSGPLWLDAKTAQGGSYELTMASMASPPSHDTQIPYILWTISLTCGLSTLAVLLRSYTRLRILHTFGADDAVMVLAQVLTIGSAVTMFFGTSETLCFLLAVHLTNMHVECAYGLGRHISDMPTDHYVPYMKSFYSSIIVYNVATCVVKMSIMLQYRRIFTVKAMQTVTLVGLVFEGAWAFTLSILLPMVCSPVSFFWNTSITGKCLNQLAIWYVMATVNLVTDFVTFSLPLPVIRSLQLPKRQKYMLMGVFCLGFFTCITSIYRITTLKAAASSTDPTWDNTNAAVWSFIEREYSLAVV